TFEPEQPHVPLVIMLVLTQLSVGTFLVEWLLRLPTHAWSALGIGILAMAASIFHLGRPQYAFRAVLGLKTSWLSREILTFGIFAVLAFTYAVVGGKALALGVV